MWKVERLILRFFIGMLVGTSSRSMWVRVNKRFYRPGQHLHPSIEHFVVPLNKNSPHKFPSLYDSINFRFLQSNRCFDVGDGANKYLWTIFKDGLQLDSMILEEQYLGKLKLCDDDTATKWKELIDKRMKYLTEGSISERSTIGSGTLKEELNVAINAVQRAAYMIRSLQHFLPKTPAASYTKADNTPVTVADFAVQALIIDSVGRAFPSDMFIAEEDSAAVRRDSKIRDTVLNVLRIATGESWSAERLCETMDKGGNGNANCKVRSTANPPRVWVLDPIDGTKGFLRGEHCCTGLGLLVNGDVELSVLGCPNLNLLRLLQGSAYDNKPIGHIDAALATFQPNSTVAAAFANETILDEQFRISIPHPDSGSVFFSVSNQGAFARSLSMPLGAAFEVSVSEVSDPAKARLCESAEAQFGDRETTGRVAASLGVQSDFLRLDGMCKHCVVGAGAAEGTLRLPPQGYREKIWDHVAGDHFVREAGGLVTDLRGGRLDYSAVHRMLGGGSGSESGGDSPRELSADVEGVIVANRRLHSTILNTVLEARRAKGNL